MSRNRPRRKKYANETWPATVMIILAAAVIPLTIVGLATRGGLPWSAFVLLIVIGAFAFVASLKVSRRQQARDDLETEQASQPELDDLRKRVETLERIVTDRRYNLEREFDALDDRRR